LRCFTCLYIGIGYTHAVEAKAALAADAHNSGGGGGGSGGDGGGSGGVAISSGGSGGVLGGGGRGGGGGIAQDELGAWSSNRFPTSCGSFPATSG